MSTGDDADGGDFSVAAAMQLMPHVSAQIGYQSVVLSPKHGGDSLDIDGWRLAARYDFGP